MNKIMQSIGCAFGVFVLHGLYTVNPWFAGVLAFIGLLTLTHPAGRKEASHEVKATQGEAD